MSLIFFSTKLFLLVMSVKVHIAGTLFLNSCPANLMWYLRAKDLCGVSDNYMCLYDTNEGKFRELCREKPEFHRPGNIFVISGNLRYFAGRTCLKNRYQPHKWWTNGSSECQYLKSTCNEEGQVPYDNGTITGNRKCRCDYTNYYTFVYSTKAKCFCDPTEEDCSCHRKKCYDDKVLTPDYDCVSTHEWTGRFVCPDYRPPKINDRRKFPEGTTICPAIKKDLSGTMQQSSARIAYMVIFGAIAVLGFLTVAYVFIKESSQEKIQVIEKKLNYQLASKMGKGLQEIKNALPAEFYITLYKL